MIEWLAGFEFLFPAMLFGAALVPALILAYLQKNQQKRRVVSSVVVLKHLSTKQAARKKFKPPLRFFLELLALICLVLAGAMPNSRNEQKRAALVIDNSFSMRASTKPGLSNESRLDQAKDAARKWIGDQPRDFSFTVFVSSPKAERVTDEGVSAREAADALGKIQPTFSGDSLEGDIQELSESANFERIVAVSDRKIEGDDQEQGSAKAADYLFGSDKPSNSKHFTRVAGIGVGTSVANIFVSNFVVTKSGTADGGLRLAATVGFSGAKTVPTKISFYSRARDGTSRLLQSLTANLSGEKSNEAAIEIPDEGSGGSVFEVRIAAGDAGAMNDAIADDNAACAVYGGSGSNKVLLVSPEKSDNRLGLGAIDSISAQEVQPEEFSRLSEEQLQDFTLIIFHRSSPTIAPRQASLFILPPQNNPLFPVAGNVAEPKMSSWISEHPITAYLKVPLINPNASEIFEVPLWAQSIVRAEAGSIVAAGESHGIRFAAVGFELLPFEGTRTPALSVLTLNIFNWLSTAGGLTGSTLSGSNFHLQGNKNWHVVFPDGTKKDFEVKNNDGENIRLSVPGVYEIAEQNSATAPRTIAANTFYLEESSTAAEKTFRTKQLVAHERIADEGTRPLWPYLLGLVLTLLIAESALSVRRNPEKV